MDKHHFGFIGLPLSSAVQLDEVSLVDEKFRFYDELAKDNFVKTLGIEFKIKNLISEFIAYSELAAESAYRIAQENNASLRGHLDRLTSNKEAIAGSVSDLSKKILELSLTPSSAAKEAMLCFEDIKSMAYVVSTARDYKTVTVNTYNPLNPLTDKLRQLSRKYNSFRSEYFSEIDTPNLDSEFVYTYLLAFNKSIPEDERRKSADKLNDLAKVYDKRSENLLLIANAREDIQGVFGETNFTQERLIFLADCFKTQAVIDEVYSKFSSIAVSRFEEANFYARIGTSFKEIRSQ